AMENAKDIITEVCKEWYSKTGRFYDLVEPYNLEDAKKAIVIMGSEASVAKYIVNKLRKKHEKVGLLRLRVYRPFPYEIISEKLKDIEQIGILDKNVSPGIGGIVYSEIKNYLPNSIVTSFIAGLGGKNIGVEGYENIFNNLGKENEEWII
ncbi:MAG: pyruvate ferredoxin oxidoreductase, partial [Methanosarcinales archaeon]